jgi:hypothetical protein
LKKLKISCSRLENKDIDSLSFVIKELTNLESFDFQNNEALGEAISKWELPRSCCRLNLSGTFVTDKGFERICKQLPNLTSLQANKCRLGDDSIKQIFHAKNLKRLSFSFGNQFTEDGLILLSKKINTLPLETLALVSLCTATTSPEVMATLLDNLPKTIKRLSISNNTVIGNNEGCIAALIRLIERPSALESIDMEGLYIENKRSALQIMSAIKNKKGLSANYQLHNRAMTKLYIEEQTLIDVEAISVETSARLK